MSDHKSIAGQALQFFDQYKETKAKDKINALIMGMNGTGKTSLAATCPKPVYLAGFDPAGYKTVMLRDSIKKGDIIVRPFDDDNWEKPTAFRRWETELNDLTKSGFFDHIGTYFLDSFTTFARSIAYGVIAKGKPNCTEQKVLSQSGYQVQQYIAINAINKLADLPCHFIMTAHCAKEIDELNGGVEVMIEAAPSQRSAIPTAFMEKWFMRVDVKGDKPKHTIQMFNDGKYRAGTNLGTVDTFTLREEPNIYKILTKAGYDASDKPSLIETKKEQ